jgi:16S rRNA pseudouridine516 synthase
MPERIDAFLSHRGFGSRREVRALIQAGVVRVGGRTVRDHGHHVGDAEVYVRGQLVEVGIWEATLVVNKPLGQACSHDPNEAPLIYDAVPPPWTHLGLESAGRLDRDTSGLLILSTDGQLLHRLTNPRRHVTKRYRITYAGQLSAHAVDRVAKGLLIEGDDRPTLPAVLELEEPAADGLNRATLHLSEGRYHQVRLMIAALGGRVVRLHRDRIGQLELPADLESGALRELTPAELELLLATPAAP